MSSGNTLFDRCRVNTNKESDVFVGITRKEDTYEVNFPIGYHLSADEKGLRRDIYSLLNVLTRYTKKRESEIQDGLKSEDAASIPIQAYLYLIKDFFERGYYKERKTYYQTARKGKISWSRTIKKQKPVMQDNEAYYLDFVVKKSANNEDELITLVHKYCVYESFDKFGWLFTSFLPAKPKTGLTVKMMISVVNSKIQNTFKDQNRELFKNMLEVLKQLESNSQTEFRCGTYRFEYVWEKMIDRVFGIPEKYDYFPKTTWLLEDGRKYDNAYLEPDTIMRYGEKIYVLDAKYYKYGESGLPGDLPTSTSIHKQITYGEYIAETDKFLREGQHPDVYNAFLMPYDSEGRKYPTGKHIYYIGTATSQWKDNMKKYENVIGILLDVKYIMGIESRQDEMAIIKLANLIEAHCPV